MSESASFAFSFCSSLPNIGYIVQSQLNLGIVISCVYLIYFNYQLKADQSLSLIQYYFQDTKLIFHPSQLNFQTFDSVKFIGSKISMLESLKTKNSMSSVLRRRT